MKVYVVEDSEVVQERLVAMLGDIPRVEVVGVADNPEEALAGIVGQQPDAIVLDIRLRGGNGIDLLKTIRGRDRGVKVIMLTNYASRAIRERCMSAGADYFFDKSAEFDRIRAVLDTGPAPAPCDAAS